MRRVHVIEFEDLPWFPSWLRDCLTRNIVVLARFLRVPERLAPLLTRYLVQLESPAIVDLGSGSGGIMPDVLEILQRDPETRQTSLLLTDLYPNRDALVAIRARGDAQLSYAPEPLDAHDFSRVPPGLKTMINSFHHLRPHQARALLRSAYENREPLLIYEMVGHLRMPLPLWLLALPVALLSLSLMACVNSALARPFTMRQGLFTYLIPLIPLFYAWDGSASLSRIYSSEDLDEILCDLQGEGYRWERGSSRLGPFKVGTYLVGWPAPPISHKDSSDAAIAASH